MSDIEAADDTRPAEHRVVVVKGGTPTPEQAAALAAALLTVQSGEPDTTDAEVSGWQQAALLEGTGARRHSERADLARPAGMR